MFAYVDPGSGALIWQAIVASAIGCLFYAKKSRDVLLQAAARLGRFFKSSGRKGAQKD
jgi:hypothetical protein